MSGFDPTGPAEARRRQLSELYTRAGQAEAAGRMDEAIAALAQLVRLDPANTDAARRLQVLRQSGGPGFAPPIPYAIPPGPVGPSGAYVGSPTPAAPPTRRSRAWIVAVAAAAVVLAVVIGTVVLWPEDRGTVLPAPSSITPVPSGPPSAVAPSTSAPTPWSTASLSTSELRTRIPTGIRATCTDYVPPPDDGLAAGLVGALRCVPTGADAPAETWYFAYTDNAAMVAAYAPYQVGTFTDGDCTAEGQRLAYTQTEDGEEVPGGVLHCYESERGDTYFAWTHEGLDIVSFAGDPALSFAEMKTWWEKAGPYRNP